MLDRTLVVVTLTMTDVLGRTGLETHPPSHLSAGLNLLTGSPARPPQVRGQRVMEGSVTVSQSGRGGGEQSVDGRVLPLLCFLITGTV